MKGMFVALGAVVLALTFSVSSGAATAWDQAKVTDLAKQVANATVELREIVEKNPDKPAGAARKAQYSAREDLRLLVSATKRLAKRLAAGAGRDETEGLFKRAADLHALHRPGVPARRFIEDADNVDARQRAAPCQADEAFGAVGHAKQQDVAHRALGILERRGRQDAAFKKQAISQACSCLTETMMESCV